MTFRLIAALAVAASLLGAAAPARASNTQLLVLAIKWSAVMVKDAGALAPAVDKGPAQADAAALKLQKDAAAGARDMAAVQPTSAVGRRIRDQLALALRSYRQSGLELHLAVAAAQRNDAKGAQAHVARAVAIAQTGGSQMTQTTKLLPQLKP
jgi:hypothetical protein